MTAHQPTVVVTRPAPGVVLATLSRPERLNAITVGMFAELEELAASLARDEHVRVLVLTGAGRGFSSGYDLDEAKELPQLTAMGMLARQEAAARALVGLRSLPIPVVAAVNGPAAGGGFSLALAADIRLASPTATFVASFVRIGLSAGDLGLSWLLPRVIGSGRAAEITLTGRAVDAAEAERIGLVSRVVPAESLLEEALATAAAIVGNSPSGVRFSKRALQHNLEIGSYAAAVEYESRGQALLSRTADMAEALDAFLNRRPPEFTGQ
ncbi:enoyl-CoA hydratase-related protein [Curtobacterium sp. MCBD17_003]|uniref:enoyl-CoA hydratase/isomerase family protein n=1 Tax=Curtobacterium sp. MCBD17_003 TaxID=2175667 RepID=UPI000DA8B4C5|nr:enoyl-CoA hydratase-related protein [Curtobacterium sp. MCBD17_003]WIE55356.1 enoyl-CoA hydratase-related protein [Curtobacterium sp. MCBD17_003]